jgi:predicted lipoprotein with Yx(FWY)xxD motif
MKGRCLALAGLATAALVAAGCSSSGTSGSAGGSGGSGGGSSGSASGSPASHSMSTPVSGHTVRTGKVGGVVVLTDAKGFTLYWFAPDTSTTSKCNGSCASFWPPVKGPVTAVGVKGTFGTIKRSDGSVQATFDGHPLYTFKGDKAPGEASGNGLNINGGLWHQAVVSGKTPAAHPSVSHSSSGGGYGY